MASNIASKALNSLGQAIDQITTPPTNADYFANFQKANEAKHGDQTSTTNPDASEHIEAASTGQGGSDTKTQPQFDLQSWLNQKLAPINNQMNQAIQNYEKTSLDQAWMPASIQSSITNLQKLTNSALKGLMPATKAAEGSYVAGQQESELLNLLPSALIYHILNSTALPDVQNTGVQSLWKIFENINLGLPNPATPQTGEISNYLQSLSPTGLNNNVTPTSGSTG